MIKTEVFLHSKFIERWVTVARMVTVNESTDQAAVDCKMRMRNYFLFEFLVSRV